LTIDDFRPPEQPAQQPLGKILSKPVFASDAESFTIQLSPIQQYWV
jgi:hypothetical protein